MTLSLFRIFVVGGVFASGLFGQCPNTTLTWPRWIYTQEGWVYTGSHSTTGIPNAAADWNAVQSTIVLEVDAYEDIVISDDEQYRAISWHVDGI